MDHDLVGAGGEAANFKVTFQVRQNPAEYSCGMRSQTYRYLARRPVARSQEHGSGYLSSRLLRVRGLRLRHRRPEDRTYIQEEEGKESSSYKPLLYAFHFPHRLA